MPRPQGRARCLRDEPFGGRAGARRRRREQLQQQCQCLGAPGPRLPCAALRARHRGRRQRGRLLGGCGPSHWLLGDGAAVREPALRGRRLPDDVLAGRCVEGPRPARRPRHAAAGAADPQRHDAAHALRGQAGARRRQWRRLAGARGGLPRRCGALDGAGGRFRAWQWRLLVLVVRPHGPGDFAGAAPAGLGRAREGHVLARPEARRLPGGAAGEAGPRPGAHGRGGPEPPDRVRGWRRGAAHHLRLRAAAAAAPQAELELGRSPRAAAVSHPLQNHAALRRARRHHGRLQGRRALHAGEREAASSR
mmetsp:Transcript_60600/g.156140  ORF Transcript_60600/g.156140 Transcript_60600/m.156140 type:complete len:307 (-) Transcript_60600:388-1308(-)